MQTACDSYFPTPALLPEIYCNFQVDSFDEEPNILSHLTLKIPILFNPICSFPFYTIKMHWNSSQFWNCDLLSADCTDVSVLYRNVSLRKYTLLSHGKKPRNNLKWLKNKSSKCCIKFVHLNESTAIWTCTTKDFYTTFAPITQIKSKSKSIIQHVIGWHV